MSERDGIGEIIQQLGKIRSIQGEEAYQTARNAIAVELYCRPHGGEGLVLDTFPDIDMVAVKQIAEARRAMKAAEPTPDTMMMDAIRQQVPNLKTQAQFNTFMLAFDALKGTLNSYFGGETAAAEVSRDVLNKALDMAAKVTQVAESLKDIPEDQRSEQASVFTAPAAQLHEYDEQRSLLTELAALKTYAELQSWYLETAPRRTKVVSQNLRNDLFESVRQRREELSKLQ